METYLLIIVSTKNIVVTKLVGGHFQISAKYQNVPQTVVSNYIKSKEISSI